MFSFFSPLINVVFLPAPSRLSIQRNNMPR